MTIERLTQIVPPPVRPFEAFHGPWAPVEAALGVTLPPDYKDFVRLYGCGYWLKFLGINIPGASNPNVRLESTVPAAHQMFIGLDELPYPLWPEPGGLIEFGGTDDGDRFFWLPRGAPDKWGVVVWDRGFLQFEVFDCDMTDFLAGLATGEIVPRDFPDDLPQCDELFRPGWREFSRPWSRMEPQCAPGDPIRLSWRFGFYGVEGVSKCGARNREARRSD